MINDRCLLSHNIFNLEWLKKEKKCSHMSINNEIKRNKLFTPIQVHYWSISWVFVWVKWSLFSENYIHYNQSIIIIIDNNL